LIDGCCTAAGEEWEITLEEAATREIYGGLDIGRHHDLTSFTAVEKVAGLRPVRKRIDLQGMPFSQQEAILYPWFQVCRRVCIDATGLGMQFAERGAERFGKYKIEPITFTGTMKEELAYPVRMAFEDKSVRIPYADDKLKSDIRAIRKEVTASGNVRFAADRGTNGHADRFWGLALGIHASKAAAATGGYEAIEKLRPENRRIGAGL
jgi:phage FluMu gp28-like protein